MAIYNFDEPIVSVRLMTYNHDEFIRDAMDGIMMQQTDFPVEVVIGDDFSTDQTLEIIRTYSDSDNIKIKILERKIGDDYWAKRQEYGRLYNFVNILENCNGKYIALLDGDDYWTDPLKLQKQVDYLEENPSFVCSSHDVYISKDNQLKNDENSYRYYTDLVSSRFEIALFGNYNHTASLVFRNIIRDFSFFEGVYVADYVLQLELAKYGMFYKFSDKMAIYRLGVGIFTSQKSVVFRNQFKKSLELYSLNESNIYLKKILQLRVFQDKLHKIKVFKNYRNGTYLTKCFYYLSFLQILKAIYKLIFKKKYA